MLDKNKQLWPRGDSSTLCIALENGDRYFLLIQYSRTAICGAAKSILVSRRRLEINLCIIG